jgi:hypothetical protein
MALHFSSQPAGVVALHANHFFQLHHPGEPSQTGDPPEAGNSLTPFISNNHYEIKLGR